MDRNLGASQVATSSDDSLAFGDLYQWGRFADGHQCRESATTTTLATTASPNGGVAWYGRFIVNDNSPYSWLSSLDGDLWQGVDGNNNPCPEGFRLPTELEWQAEIDSWNFKTLAGAFDSPLKLTAAGSRSHSTGSPIYSTWGLYWTNNGSSAITLLIQGSNARMSSTERATAHSVRCIQDGP